MFLEYPKVHMGVVPMKLSIRKRQLRAIGTLRAVAKISTLASIRHMD